MGIASKDYENFIQKHLSNNVSILNCPRSCRTYT